VDVVLDNLDVYVDGFTTTVLLTLAAAAVALVLGTIVAAMRVSPVPPLRAVGTLYVNVVRWRCRSTRRPSSPRRSGLASTRCQRARRRRAARSG
jgi:hypothetical protein